MSVTALILCNNEIADIMLKKGKLKLILTVLVLCGTLGVATKSVWADSVTTTVTVGNSGPSFTVAPAESPASDATTPTNAGSNVTFQATATDSNNESYYLILCKTNSVTAVNGGAPTCPGTSWCTSTLTASAAQATCSYTTLNGDAESNVWYAFACDANASSAACSASSQGSGSSGSPFKVNHRPVFDTISNDGPKNPGAGVTWSTNTNTTDADTDGTPDTVKLLVCKTSGIAAGDCDGGSGDRWCQSSLVTNNPSCTYTLPTPTVDDTYAAYVYLVDNHNFAASGGSHGTQSDYTVNNIAPVVTAVSINGGSDITLTEGTTTAIALSATITDNNSCTDVSAVESSLYRSGVGFAACDDNSEDDSNDCYAQITCTVAVSGNTCDGTSDAAATYQCTVNIQFHADPTDAATQYPSETWKSTFVATDDDAASSNTEISTGVEMSSLVGYDVSATIGYGNLSVGQKNDPLDKTTTITATGNVGLDQELSGTDMTDGGSNSIAVGEQKYALATSTAYASGTSLGTSPLEVELNVLKTITTLSPATKNTWWGLNIPSGTPAGSYSGTNTIVAVKGEIANW